MDSKHIVEFSRYGYALQHPLSCRPNLLDCRFNQYLSLLDEPELEPGRYEMLNLVGNFYSYAPLLGEEN